MHRLYLKIYKEWWAEIIITFLVIVKALEESFNSLFVFVVLGFLLLFFIYYWLIFIEYTLILNLSLKEELNYLYSFATVYYLYEYVLIKIEYIVFHVYIIHVKIYICEQVCKYTLTRSKCGTLRNCFPLQMTHGQRLSRIYQLTDLLCVLHSPGNDFCLPRYLVYLPNPCWLKLLFNLDLCIACPTAVCRRFG